jgi:hypothetical protein
MAKNSDDRIAQKLPNFDERWDYSDPAGTEKVFRDLLAERLAMGSAT